MRSESAKLNLLVMRSESAKLNLLVTGGMRSKSAKFVRVCQLTKLNLLVMLSRVRVGQVEPSCHAVRVGQVEPSCHCRRPHRKGASRSSRPKSQATPQGRLKEFETEVHHKPGRPITRERAPRDGEF
jgi:hypothetical protein